MSSIKCCFADVARDGSLLEYWRQDMEKCVIFFLLEKGLGESCQYSKECRGFNTQCNQMQCTCDYGFLVINGTDSCSGKILIISK